MDQVLVYLKKNGAINIDVLDNKRRELVALGVALKSGCRSEIATHVEMALEAGANKDDILKVVSFIMKENQLLKSIIELIKILDYEENRRAPYISVLDDVRE